MTSKIDAFKAGSPPKPRLASPTESLVGIASFKRNGPKSNTYVYNDGRSCEHPDGPFHDCEYVDQRNALIPRATQMADAEHAKARVGLTAATGDGKSWDQRYMEAMDRLWTGAPQ
jgi:hypothetical protein